MKRILFAILALLIFSAPALAERGTIDGNPPVLNDNTDINIISPSADEHLVYDGSNWTNTVPSINDNSDVTVGTAITNDTLVHNGTAWTNQGPAYASIELASADNKTATSVAVANGTITTGTITNTLTVDGTYLEVNESGQFLIDFTFSGLGTRGPPAIVDIVGRYEGNPGHNVKLQAWNYVGLTWDDFTGDAQDFPSAATDSDFRFAFPDLTSYSSGGQAIVRINHTSAATGTHDFFIDKISVDQASVQMPQAGTYYLINGITEGRSADATVDEDAGSITIGTTGDYMSSLSSSFSGESNGGSGVDYHMHVFLNGANRHANGFARSISSSTDIGSGHGNGIMHLTAGDILTIKVSAEVDDAFVSLRHLNFSIHRPY